MINELIFFTIAVLDLTFIVIVSKLGKSWLQAAIILNILLISTFGAKLVPLFGFTTNAGNVFYAAVFFATQLLVERYGAREGYRSIGLGICSLIFFILMSQLIVAALGVPATETVNRAITILFQAAPRIAIASLVAYALSQGFAVWLFDRLKDRRIGRQAFVRLNASNVVGQLVDSLLFFTIAFYGTVSAATLGQALLVGLILKVAVGALSTLFFYISSRIAPLPVEDGTAVVTPALPLLPTTRFIQLIVITATTMPVVLMATLSYRRLPEVFAPSLLVVALNVLLALIITGAIMQLRRSRARLRDNEEKLMAAQRLAHVGSFEWDSHTNVMTWSDELYKIFGRSREQFTPTFDAFLAELQPKNRRMVTEALQSAWPSSAEFKFEEQRVRADGQQQTTYTIGRITADPRGDSRRLRGTCQDVTWQTRAQQQLAEQNRVLEDTQRAMLNAFEDSSEANATTQAILQSLGDGLLVIDQRGRVVMINEAARDILRLTTPDVRGQDVLKLLPLEDKGGTVIPAKERPSFRALQHGESIREREYYVRLSDRTQLPIAMTVTPLVVNDKVIGAIDIFRDITQAKRVAAMKEEQLQHERALEQQEREFVTMASHQLLTPVALIQGYLSLLLSGKHGRVNANVKNYLAECLRGAQRISNLVEKLLTTARLESRRVPVSTDTFDVHEIIAQVCREQQSAADHKHLQLYHRRPAPLWVKADPAHVHEVVSNLINNAIKYTEHGEITINAAAQSDTSPPQARISITDTGLGIPAPELPRIFGKYAMSKNWVAQHGKSNSLGLYISKLLLTLMGGTIKVASELGKGSTFTFTLPLAPTPHGQNTTH